jgi:N-acetylmuramoyl-L-alanine amidase
LRFLLSAFRVRRPVIAAVAALAVLFTPGIRAQSTPLTVLSKDGRRALTTTVINDQEFVSLDELAAMFQLSLAEDALGAVTATYKGRTIVLTPDQALASVAGRLVVLPTTPRRAAGGRRWLVPDEFLRALVLVYDSKIELRKPSHLVIVGDLRVPRVQLQYDFSAAAGHLTIVTTPRANGSVSRDGDRLTVKFDADGIDLSPPVVQLPPQTLIQSIRVGDAATLTADLSARFGSFKATNSSTETAGRLVIDITAQSPDAQPPPVSSQTQPPPPDATLPPLPLPGGTPVTTSIRTIAVDPGHGGDDEGARSADGAKEKDLTLAVARKLKALVESRMGVRVLLTREDDRAVSIDDRTASANNGKADLFISLHANASLRPALSGASIATAAFDDEARASARALAPERVAAAGGGSREIEFVPWAVAQIPHLERSQALATIIEQQFRRRIPLAARPIEAAPLRVLESANMPAVLIEMGYLTNADQARALASGEFQNAFVQAAFDAIVRFRDALDDEHREGAARGK